jgi:hypothetical protein
MSEIPEGLQLDLLTAVLRMRQIRDEGSEFILYRLLTCDLPRLEQYLEPETLRWAETTDAEIPGRS